MDNEGRECIALPPFFLRVCLVGAFCTKFQRATSSFASSKLRCRSFIWHKNPSTKPTRRGERMGAGETGETRKVGNPIPPISPVLPILPVPPVPPVPLATLVTPATLVTLAIPAPCNPCSSRSVGSRGYAHKKAESSVCTVQPRTPPIELWRLRRAFYAFLIAATPGNSLPSINSRRAPPPVET